MKNFDVYEESKFFEKLMTDGQKIRKQEEEKCRDCSYGICDECKVKGIK